MGGDGGGVNKILNDDNVVCGNRRPIANHDDNDVHVVCASYLSPMKKGGDREGVTIGAQTTCDPLSSSINSERDNHKKTLSSCFQGGSSSIDSRRHDSNEYQTTCPHRGDNVDKHTGNSIMEFIQKKMKSYGGIETDHKFNAISDLLAGEGHEDGAIQFCIKRYREGHRIFTPPIRDE